MNSLEIFNLTAPSVGVASLLLTQLMSTLVTSYNDLHPSYPPDKSQLIFDQTFDFIIVGSGSAGSAVANRLSEHTQWKVLLIEAGPDPPVESEIPILSGAIHDRKKYDWRYYAEGGEYACKNMRNGRCALNRGKMLGGCTQVNNMMYTRGFPKDYDSWKDSGNDGWGYDDVLPYFKKLERVETPRLQMDIHGYNGNVFVQDFTMNGARQEATNIFVQAANELGYPYIEDISAHPKSGTTVFPGTIRNNVRWGTARAYLVPAQDRANLFVAKDTTATKLLIDENKRVYGVEVFTGGIRHRVYSSKEVIVSAGAVNSPQLLMLSGIGPADNLRQVGIPVIEDLKVGFNLQDHVLVASHFFKLNLTRENVTVNDVLYNYLTKKTLLGETGMSTMIFVDTLNGTEDYPDVQFHTAVYPFQMKQLPALLQQVHIKPELSSGIINANLEADILMLFPTLLRPRSRGRVSLNSADPFDPPKIVAGYLTDPEDVATVIRGMRFMQRLANSAALKKAVMSEMLATECAPLTRNTTEYYECYARNFASSVYHVSGSCKMGPDGDPDAVVNPRLKVRGMQGLRVADASVMPRIVSGNINIPTIMIGEKAADLIKEDWRADEHADRL